MAEIPDECGSRAYSLYTWLRWYFESLREHWDKLTHEEQDGVSQELEAFVNSVWPLDGWRPG